MNKKLKFFLVHLLVSVCLAGILLALLFFVWYPDGYYRVGKGLEVALIVLACEVSLGPLLTLIVYKPSKPKRELLFDYSFICSVQLGFLLYGWYTLESARPQYEIVSPQGIVVLSAFELEKELPDSIKSGLLTGPKIYCVSPSESADEVISDTLSLLNLGGLYLEAERYQTCEHSEILSRVSDKELPVRWLEYDAESMAWIKGHSRFGEFVYVVDRVSLERIKVLPGSAN